MRFSEAFTALLRKRVDAISLEDESRWKIMCESHAAELCGRSQLCWAVSGFRKDSVSKDIQHFET